MNEISSKVDIVAHTEFHTYGSGSKTLSYTIPKDGILHYMGTYCIDSLSEKLNGTQISLETNTKVLNATIHLNNSIIVKKDDVFEISYFHSESTFHCINVYLE